MSKLYFSDLLLQYSLQPATTAKHHSGIANSAAPAGNDFAPHRVPVVIRPSSTMPVVNPILSSAEVYEYPKGGYGHSQLQQRKLWFGTREGNILSFDCDADALKAFGYRHGDRMLASWGPTSGTWSTVVGVRRGVLWVREDGALEDGVCALVGFQSKADFETRLGWVWHGNSTVPETQHVILPTLLHAAEAAQVVGAHDLHTSDQSTALLMKRLRCCPNTMHAAFGFFHGEVLYQDREGMSHEGLRLPMSESNPTLGRHNTIHSAGGGAANPSSLFFGGGFGSHERLAVHSNAATAPNTESVVAATAVAAINISVAVIPAGVDEVTGDLYAFFVDTNRYLSHLWDSQRTSGLEPSLLVTAEDIHHARMQATTSNSGRGGESASPTLPILSSTSFVQRLPGCRTASDVRRLLGLTSSRPTASDSVPQANDANQFDAAWKGVAKIVSQGSHSLLNAMLPVGAMASKLSGIAPLQAPQSEQCVYLMQNDAIWTATTSNESTSFVTPSRRVGDIFTLL